MSLHSTTDLEEFAVMLNEFASSCYDHSVLATHSNTSLFECVDTVSILSGDVTTAITGFEAFDEDITEREAVRRIHAMLSSPAGTSTIIAGEACISIGPGRPFVRATRPTPDVLVIESGGMRPSVMIMIVDRTPGPVDTETG